MFSDGWIQRGSIKPKQGWMVKESEMKRYMFWVLAGLLTTAPLWAETGVRIAGLRGDVRIRRGMDETWSAAGLGMWLKPLDTVFSGEASEVVLTLEDQTRFTLGGDAMLDVGDLRRITERQLFLFLMSQKAGRMSAPDSGSAIHITNVSVVRGSQKQLNTAPSPRPDTLTWIREKNGAKALFDAGLLPNAVVKFCTVLQRYPSILDRGEIHSYLGQAFEALKEPGRALDAYQTGLDEVNGCKEPSQPVLERKARIEASINRLRSKSN
jgi:hypothetical protein